MTFLNTDERLYCWKCRQERTMLVKVRIPFNRKFQPEGYMDEYWCVTCVKKHKDEEPKKTSS